MNRLPLSFVQARLGAALLWGLCCSSCAWIAKPGAPSDPLYAQATKQFLSQNYSSAMSTYTKYIESDRTSPYVAEAYFGRGMCSFAQGNYLTAKQDFEKCMRKTADRELQATALLRLGECYRRLEEFHKAEEVYRLLLRKYPDVEKQDEVLFLLGVACLRQGKWDDAENYLGQVIRNYPYSTRKSLAQEKMPGVDRFFSVQVCALREKPKADAVAKELAKRGFDAFIRTVNRAGETSYCVRTGKFSSWEEVKKFAEQVKAAGFVDVMLVP